MSNLWLWFAILCVTSARVVEDVASANDHESRAEMEPDDIIESGFRNAASKSYKRWANAVIPYRIDFGFTEVQKKAIVQEMRNLESFTSSGSTKCINFRQKRGTDIFFLLIRLGTSGCVSSVGINGWQTRMLLAPSCFPKKAVLHELMHALGFYHEQTRTDRDSYVKMILDNVPDYLKASLEITRDSMNQSIPYDFGSILHYHEYYVIPKLDYYIGGRRVALGLPMSESDVIRIQRFYGCTEDLTNFRRLNQRNLTVDCSFDKDFCNLTQSTDPGVDGFDWTRGTTSTAAKGPSRGYFVYAEAKNHQGQMARLKSPVLEPGQYCVSMAAYQNSFSDGNVFIIRVVDADDEKSAKRLVVKKKGSGKDDHWELITEFNFKVKNRWYLGLDAKIGENSQMDVAIDDVILRKC